ncbi:MAG: hypothetical protein ACLSHG_10215 [Oscillospiraceae bacterium]
MLSASSVCASRDARGSNRRSTGCSSLDSPAAMPLRCRDLHHAGLQADHAAHRQANVTACCTPCAAARRRPRYPVAAPWISAHAPCLPRPGQCHAFASFPRNCGLSRRCIRLCATARHGNQCRYVRRTALGRCGVVADD